MKFNTSSILCIFAAASLASCSSLSFGEARKLSLNEASSVLTSAQLSLDSGDHERAFWELKSLLDLEGLPTSQRSAVLQLFGVAAERQLIDLSADPDGAEQLADLVNEELPREISVAAGIASARLYIENDDAKEAWLTLRRLDERFPLHHERPLAGRLLLQAGLLLSYDERSWWIFWSARGEGTACLEYLVLTHPALPSCDEAYLRLGEIYGEDRLRLLAIERYSDLVLYHPTSPLRSLAQARIPMLRLELLDSPEFDRNGLLLALAELEDWMTRFTGHPLQEDVLAARLDCLRRLSSSDLGIARFYARVENNEGKRYHAERALELAQNANDQTLAAQARALMPASKTQDS
mgnify:CR=1 FL=1